MLAGRSNLPAHSLSEPFRSTTPPPACFTFLIHGRLFHLQASPSAIHPNSLIHRRKGQVGSRSLPGFRSSKRKRPQASHFPQESHSLFSFQLSSPFLCLFAQIATQSTHLCRQILSQLFLSFLNFPASTGPLSPRENDPSSSHSSSRRIGGSKLPIPSRRRSTASCQVVDACWVWEIACTFDREVCSMKDGPTGEETLALELVSWKKELSESELERRTYMECEGSVCKRKRIPFPISFPKGFDLKKTVKNWMEEWQSLPYISPYTNAFHLASNSDQAEKWTVAVLHELLWILISKKTERENVLCVGEYLGFGSARFKKALVHHPGIFYVSNKIRTRTVVLREAYKKDLLVEKHPLMGMRHRYIYLMNKVVERRKLGDASKRRS